MSVYTRIVSGLLFPLHERLKGHSTLSVFHALEKSQWLDAGGTAELQVANLRRFLVDIGDHVPYYREQFRALNFDPKAVTSLTDLQRLPLIGKADIRENTERMKADGSGALQRFNTGGSSGEPLIFYLGKERVSHDVAAKRRATRWWGVDIGDPEIVVWGSPIELGAQDRLRQIRDWLFRTQLLSAFEMSQQKLDGFIDRIRRVKPKMLFGYPSAISLIAERARQIDQPLSNLGIKVVFVTSERLYDHQRELIETTFGCPVANGYGGRDAGFIAHQCPSGGMHLTSEDIVVEIVDEEGHAVPAGESGEIVVTHLATRDFPFVRYRTGDVARLGREPCACGRGLPQLEDIQGRTTDFLIAQDGTRLHGLSLIYILRDEEGVAAFRIVQESLSLVRIELVTNEKYGTGREQVIADKVRQRLGHNVQVEFDYLQTIPLEKSGKYRYVKCNV
jgi:phenylacetate-CoA ligase